MSALTESFELVGAYQLAAKPIEWLWPGFLGRGLVTHFPTQTWMGKTTLLSLLLKAMANGGELLGEPVAAGKAVIVTDEAGTIWWERHAKLGFGSHVQWILSPFRGQPDEDGWLRMIDRLCRIDADLFVLDPLGMLLPRGLENSAAVLDSLEYLHLITERNACVQTIHHTPVGRKGDVFSSRGFSGILGFANVLMKMELPKGEAPTTRLRTITTQSRLRGMEVRAAELNPEGTEYKMLPKPVLADSFEGGWPVLRMVLEDTRYRITRQEILAGWPPDFEKPSLESVRRWLETAMETGLVVRRGRGRAYSPFKYALAGRKDIEEDVLGAFNPVTGREEHDFEDYPKRPKPPTQPR